MGKKQPPSVVHLTRPEPLATDGLRSASTHASQSLLPSAKRSPRSRPPQVQSQAQPPSSTVMPTATTAGRSLANDALASINAISHVISHFINIQKPPPKLSKLLSANLLSQPRNIQLAAPTLLVHYPLALNSPMPPIFRCVARRQVI